MLNTLDMSCFILRPEIAENGCRIVYRLGRDVIGDDKTIRISLAKSMHICSLSLHTIPLISGQAGSLLQAVPLPEQTAMGIEGIPVKFPYKY